MRVDAVILAGGDGAVIDPQCRFKGLVRVGGKPLVEWVVDACREATMLEGLAVVVPTAEDLGPWADKVDKVVVSDGSFMENLIAGIQAFRVDRPVLVSTGDLPLLDGPALDDFCKTSLASGAEFAYPIIRKDDILAQYPGTKRTFIRLKEATVTGGNMIILNPALVERNSRVGQSLFAARKSPIGMAKVLGVRFVAKFVAGTLTIAELEAKMSEVLGGSSAAVFTRHGSIGIDVDKPEDVVLVERVLSDTRAGDYRSSGSP